MGVVALFNAEKHLSEVFEGHIGLNGRAFAVTAAMAAFHIASKCGFPENLVEWMLLLHLFRNLPV
jgi:hypothetical protein